MSGNEAAAIPEYVIALVEQRLLHDPRVGEQGLRTEIHGHRIVISGVVPTAERQALVAVVAAEVAPEDYEIVNQTELAVTPAARPDEEFS
ncbi:MAG TPA: hypothetical protein VGQ20_01670 [Acidimicrobiales bacterium]|jgi:hypothetical protein|nr:hypothetical protein [Acidimicrobiales bacterium]